MHNLNPAATTLVLLTGPPGHQHHSATTGATGRFLLLVCDSSIRFEYRLRVNLRHFNKCVAVSTCLCRGHCAVGCYCRQSVAPTATAILIWFLCSYSVFRQWLPSSARSCRRQGDGSTATAAALPGECPAAPFGASHPGRFWLHQCYTKHRFQAATDDACRSAQH